MNTRPTGKIVGLGGSMRERSYSSVALRTALDIAKQLGSSTEMLDLRVLDLPIYIPDQPIEGYPPKSQEAVRNLVAAFPPYLQGRAIGLISIGDSSALGAMANCANELRAWLAPTRVTLTSTDFSPDLILTSESGIRRLTRLVTELREFT